MQLQPRRLGQGLVAAATTTRVGPLLLQPHRLGPGPSCRNGADLGCAHATAAEPIGVGPQQPQPG